MQQQNALIEIKSTENNKNEEFDTLSVQNIYGDCDFNISPFTMIEVKEKRSLIIKFEYLRATAEFVNDFSDVINKINSSRYNHYVIDLSNTYFIDSSFLGMIIMYYKKVSKFGAKFSLVIDYDKMRLFKRIFIFNNLLNIYNSMDDVY